MKFLIIQIWDSHCHNGPAFNELAKITSQSTKEYCEFHGYDYLFLDKNPDPTRPISWGRSFLIKDLLDKYDWIWAIDSDLMIMNHSIRLENLVDDNYSVMVAANEGKIDRINTGSILWKNSQVSKRILDDLYNDEEFANKGYWEQSGLIKFIKNNSDFLQHSIKIVSPRLINSFYHYWFGDENFQHGDFVVHLAGQDNDFRMETLNKLKGFIIKPINNIQEKVKIWDR